MKKLFTLYSLLFTLCAICTVHAADEKFLSCGPGYVLESRSKIDGVVAMECKKLWCRDLESGKKMGDGNAAATGYKTTSAPNELCDAQNHCVECFGDRKWCAGETVGQWNPEFGAYTRGGDNATYLSYQKSGCFAWRLEKPNCPGGETAILKNGEWLCATSKGSGGTGSRESGVRRTGTIRQIIR